MRFHHSTRRGRNRLGQHNQHQSSNYRTAHHSAHSTSRWAQLGYCRETNIHFNRRLPVELPPVECLLASRRLWSTSVDSAAMEEEAADEQKDLIQDRLHELSLEEQKPEEARGRKQQQQLVQLAGGQSKLDMESAREKLVAQVEKHPFWSSKAARRMQLTGVEERRIYIYELVSFCERRDLEWRYEPYRGGGLASAVPFRRLELPAGSGSGPSTPVRAAAALATPSSLCSSAAGSPSSGVASADSLAFSRSIPHLSSANSMQRSFSGSTSSQAGKTTRYEPLSAIERPEPSPQHVWALPTPGAGPAEPFVGHTHSAELANSSFVKRCHGCQGRGRLKCTSCYGVGYEVCISCSGKGTTKSLCSAASSRNSAGHSDHSRSSIYANGYDQDSPDCSPFGARSADQPKRANEPGGISGAAGSVSASAWTAEACHFCHGAGQKRCWVCAGKSFNHCLGCLGSGQLRCYLNLNITWLNHRDESILNNPDAIIPRDRLRLCSGLVLLDQQADSLGALQRKRIDGATGHADHSNQLHLASKKLLDKHQQSYRQERLLKQVSSTRQSSTRHS